MIARSAFRAQPWRNDPPCGISRASTRCGVALSSAQAALIRPQGQLTLSMSANQAVQEELLHYLAALKAA